MSYALQIQMLKAAELQFRLAAAVRLATTGKIQPFDLPSIWTHGKHQVSNEEICLTPEQADYAAYGLYQSSTFMIAVQVFKAIRHAVENPKIHTDENIKSAYQISRMIRNAFTHQPLNPIWSIDKDCQNCLFVVEGVITLDTTSLDGTKFDWRHFEH